MAANDDRHRSLLSRRVPRDQIELGRAYVIHARNGGVGVAVTDFTAWTKTALSVLDPLAMTIYDDSHSTTDEDRWITMGLVGSDLLVVVHTHRELGPDDVHVSHLGSARDKARAQPVRRGHMKDEYDLRRCRTRDGARLAGEPPPSLGYHYL